MNRAKFIKTMGDNIRRYESEKSTLFQIFKKTCRFQLNRTEFAKYIKSMKERKDNINKIEQNLKHENQVGQVGGGRRDYKQFIIQTGGGREMEEIAADADFAEVALFEEDEAQQQIRDIQEEKLLTKAEWEIRDIKNEEVQKIMKMESILSGRTAAATSEAVSAAAHAESGADAVAALEVQAEAVAEDEAFAAAAAASTTVERMEKEIGIKIKRLQKTIEKNEIIEEFTERLNVAKRELDIKVIETLHLRCGEMKLAPRRQSRAASSASVDRKYASEQFENLCDKAMGIYKTGDVKNIIELRQKKSKNAPKKFTARRILWDIFRENNLIVKRIKLNYERIQIARKKPSSLQRFGAAMKKLVHKRGGRHTRRKKKKCKKHTRRK